MAAVTICSDLESKNEILYSWTPNHIQEVMGPDAMTFFECWVFSQLFQSPLSSSPRGSLVPLCFLPIMVVSSAYLRLLIFLPAILIPACASSSPAFLMMCSACKLISRVTVYSLDVLLFLFGTSLVLRPLSLLLLLPTVGLWQWNVCHWRHPKLFLWRTRGGNQ